jgi:hypothetical protein
LLPGKAILNVARSPADFSNDDVRFGLFRDFQNSILNFVRHMGNHLDRFAQVLSAPFLIQYGLINLAAGQVVESGQIRVRKPFVMPKSRSVSAPSSST